MSRHIVIEGNLTRDPTGGYGKDTGKAYTHLDVAVTDRIKNEHGWVDGPATYYRVTVFGQKRPKTPPTAQDRRTDRPEHAKARSTEGPQFRRPEHAKARTPRQPKYVHDGVCN